MKKYAQKHVGTHSNNITEEMVSSVKEAWRFMHNSKKKKRKTPQGNTLKKERSQSRKKIELKKI